MRGSEEQIGFLLFRLAITRTREPMEKRRCSNGSSKNHAKWMLFLCAKKPTNTTTCKRRLFPIFRSRPEPMSHALMRSVSLAAGARTSNIVKVDRRRARLPRTNNNGASRTCRQESLE